MAPSAWIHCLDTSLGANNKMGPKKRAAYFSFMMMYDDVIFTHRPPLLKEESFFECTTPCSLRYKTRKKAHSLGKMGSLQG